MSNEFDGLTHHIAEARSKTRMFKGLNGFSQHCQVCRCHACQIHSPTTLINASLRQYVYWLARKQVQHVIDHDESIDYAWTSIKWKTQLRQKRPAYMSSILMNEKMGGNNDGYPKPSEDAEGRALDA